MKCPTCGKSIEWQDNPFRPFCSERCKMIDLGRWVSEEYRVPDKSSPVDPSEDSDDRKDSSEDN